MNEPVKIIEIPNFIKVKIVKINEKHCAYFVENYSNEYFYADEDDFLKTYTRDRISFTLTLDIPFTIDNIDVEHLEEAIYKLYRKLTQNIIPRAKKGQEYYVINDNFRVSKTTEFNDRLDNKQYRTYNYFVSESKAEEFASKIQNYIIELWKEELKNEN